jgi:hypothetical protein
VKRRSMILLLGRDVETYFALRAKFTCRWSWIEVARIYGTG